MCIHKNTHNATYLFNLSGAHTDRRSQHSTAQYQSQPQHRDAETDGNYNGTQCTGLHTWLFAGAWVICKQIQLHLPACTNIRVSMANKRCEWMGRRSVWHGIMVCVCECLVSGNGFAVAKVEINLYYQLLLISRGPGCRRYYCVKTESAWTQLANTHYHHFPFTETAAGIRFIVS